MKIARRRRLLFAASSLVAGVMIFACGFPDVTFGPAAIEAGPESGGADSSVNEAGDAGDASLEEDSGPLLIDGSTLDALVVTDAGGKIDAAGCTSCDCDGDKYNDLGKPGCAAAGGQSDCDDEDSRSRPLQGFLFDEAEPPRNGDWDCNGDVEKLYTREDTKCSGLTLGLGCADIFGFTEPVACGKTGRWIRCKKRSGLITVDCVVGEDRLETQLCK